jgi:hypothetical protein
MFASPVALAGNALTTAVVKDIGSSFVSLRPPAICPGVFQFRALCCADFIEEMEMERKKIARYA